MHADPLTICGPGFSSHSSRCIFCWLGVMQSGIDFPTNEIPGATCRTLNAVGRKPHNLGAAPLSNSWIMNIIWLYVALNRTPNIDCYNITLISYSFHFIFHYPNITPNIDCKLLGGGSTQPITLHTPERTQVPVYLPCLRHLSNVFWWLNLVRLYSLYKILYPKRRKESYSILGIIVSPNKILLI